MSYFVRPYFINEKDWDIVCKYADDNRISPHLIAAVGWVETSWGQKGQGRDYVLNYNGPPELVISSTLAGRNVLRDFKQQIKYGASALGQFFRNRLINEQTLLQFAKEYRTQTWNIEDKSVNPESWARSVWNAYQEITTPGGKLRSDSPQEKLESRGAVPRNLQLKDSIEEVPPWFNPEEKSYFTRWLEPDREDGHSPIDPTEYSYEQIINMMHYNQVQYGCQGRLLQAFPTFLMTFIDEGEWVGGRKLWNNLYLYHSLVSIDVVKERGNPADVAKIELTNVYGALNHHTIPPKMAEMGLIQKVFHRLFPGITEHSLEMRKQFMKDLMVRPGARVHIRMGYGSSASRLPIVFNGVITEVDTQDLATFVAQGDGHELLNEMTSFGPEDRTGLFRFGNEPTDIIREILCARGKSFHFSSKLLSSVLTRLNKDYAHHGLDKDYVFGATNPFGIEHFGTVRKDQHDLINLGKDIKTWDVMTNVYPLTVDMGELNRHWLDMVYGVNEDDTSSKSLWDRVKEWGSQVVGNIDDYLDELKRKISGEPNIGIWLGEKTPWDVFRIISRCSTGYIPTVFPFQFRSSFFHGLPWWPACIKYRNKPGVGIEQVFTTLQQFYYFSSHSDIIYNDIKASSRNIITNAAALYTRGSGSVLAPVVMADHTIRNDLQKSEVVDSGTVQDIKFLPDGVLHYLSFQHGEDRAITYAQSYVVERLRDMYQGELILRGTPAVKPYDLFFLDDAYSHMHGLAEVGRVVHSMSPQTGFITSIKPDLVSRHLEEAELWGQLYTGLISAGVWAGLKGLNVIKWARTTGLAYLTARAALVGQKLHRLYLGAKTAEIIKTAHGTITISALAAREAASGVASTIGGTIGGAVGSIVAPGAGTVIGTAVGSLLVDFAVMGLINSAVKFVQKYFSTRNMVKIYPMFLRDKPYVAGITGAKYLMAYGSYDNLFHEVEEEKGKKETNTLGQTGQLHIPESSKYLGVLSDRPGTITSRFGPRKTMVINGQKTSDKHKGIDIAFKGGAPIKAALSGKVVKAGCGFYGYGCFVEIDHGDCVTRYGHMAEGSIRVYPNQYVEAGQVIGLQGSTGLATGPHLHFELLLRKNGKYEHVDPEPFLPPAMFNR